MKALILVWTAQVTAGKRAGQGVCTLEGNGLWGRRHSVHEN